MERYYIIKGIQSWAFKGKDGSDVVGSKLFLEHVPAKAGTVGTSYEEVKLLQNVKDSLIELYGGENNLIGVEISSINYDKYGRVNGFQFR